MSKFNGRTVPTVTAPVKTATVATGRTFNGAPGFERDARSELFLLAVSNMVNEKAFYETASERDTRFEGLVSQVAVTDPEWFQKFVGWLRGPEANMRSASLVAAAAGVKARLANNMSGNRQIISSVLQRADEPGEMLAYWHQTYGRAVPKPVKRGVADAVRRLYNEYGTLKYDTQSSAVRFADVLAICHPEAVARWQSDLFAFINARRWNRDAEFAFPETLTMVNARRIADQLTREQLLENPDLMKQAGYTWENIAGKGAMDARAWETVIPQMGIFALLRNLRNFDQAGISREAQDAVRAKLVDPEVIAKSRLFPFRFLSAHQAVKSENWGRELETALNLSLNNVPELKGRTLILVDRSGSMFWSKAGGSLSDMQQADVAALFGTALALRSESADLYGYDDNRWAIPLQKGQSVLKTVKDFGGGGGTSTEAVLRATFQRDVHDRVVIITDEQADAHRYSGVASWVPESVPVVTWNLVGYGRGHEAGTKNRWTFGGLTDAAFKVLPLLEAGRSADWDQIFSA